jgi:hypothetical protein
VFATHTNPMGEKNKMKSLMVTSHT